MNTLLSTNRIYPHFLIIAFLCQGMLQSKAVQANSITVTCPTDISVGIYGNDCTTSVLLPSIGATSNCGGSLSYYFTSPFGVGQGPHYGVATGVYPVSVLITDACGNASTCSFQIRVEDKRKPTPVLVQTLYGNINSGGQIAVHAREFNQASHDNCAAQHELRYAYSSNVSDTLRIFNCSQIGVMPLQIFVFDANGNANSSNVKIEVMDNEGKCNALLTAQAGALKPKGEPIAGVSLKFAGGAQNITQITASNGSVTAALTLDHTLDWTVDAYLDDNVLNGVNIYDVWLLQRYILGQEQLSAYQLLAADVNGDQKVTSSDILSMRDVILGKISQFPVNRSWRFIPADYVFPAPAFPFNNPIPKQIILEAGTTGLQQVQFTGIKLGDINENAISSIMNRPMTTNSRSQNTEQEVQISIDDAYLHAGKVVQVPVFIEPDQDLAALQFDLGFDPQYVDITFVDGFKTPCGETAQTHLSETQHTINVNYSGEIQHIQRTHLITVSVLPKTDGYLSDFFSLNPSRINAEAFNKSGTMFNIQLDFTHPFLVPVVESDNQPITMVGNSPNPFVEMSILHFVLSHDAHTTLRVFDAEGKQVSVQSNFFTKGPQMFLLKKDDIGHPGVYHCRIETAAGCVTKKVIMF